jgi:hypothetical protein
MKCKGNKGEKYELVKEIKETKVKYLALTETRKTGQRIR